MSIYMLALAAMSSTVLPGIDRAALDRQAIAEAVRAAPPVKAKPAPKPAAVIKASASVPVGKRFRLDDINEHSAVCRAAGASGDPARFIEAFGNGYFLSRGETAALAEGCAIYFARAAASQFRR